MLHLMSNLFNYNKFWDFVYAFFKFTRSNLICDPMGPGETANWLHYPNENDNCCFLLVIYCDLLQMGPMESDHNKQLITLTMITLSGFHCNNFNNIRWAASRSGHFVLLLNVGGLAPRRWTPLFTLVTSLSSTQTGNHLVVTCNYSIISSSKRWTLIWRVSFNLLQFSGKIIIE